MDKRDPNYDSSEDESDLVYISHGMSSSEISERVEALVREFFEHNDVGEVLQSLHEIGKIAARHKPQIVYSVVRVALDGRLADRELASQLLAELYGEVLIECDYEEGFSRLLQDLADIQLDSPDASLQLGNFIARCCADDCLAPKCV